MADNEGQWDNPEELSVEPDTSEEDFRDVEHEVHRLEHGHEETYQRTYRERVAREEASHKRKYSQAEAAERIKRGFLKRNYNPHSRKLIAWSTAKKPPEGYRMPNPEQANKQIQDKYIQHEQLRSEYMRTGKLKPSDLIKFRKLHDDLLRTPLSSEEENERKPSLFVLPTGKRLLTPHQQENERFEAVKKNFPVEPNVVSRSHLIEGPDLMLEQRGTGGRENVEDTIRKYGQEELHTHIPKTTATLSAEHGWIEEPTRNGWESTYRFNKEQYRRKLKGLRTGETALGFGEKGAVGYGTGVPVEKAKLTVGPNQEHVIKTSKWDQVGEAPVRDKYVVRLQQGPPHQSFDSEGRFYQQGQSISETLQKAGVPVTLATTLVPYNDPNYKSAVKGSQPAQGTTKRGAFRKIRKHGKTPAQYEYTLITDQGEHLNPDQIAKLQETLHLHHGLTQFKTVEGAQFQNLRAVVPVGYNKLPKGISEDDIMPGSYRKNIYSHRFGTKFGERDPISGELLPGEKDTAGMKVGKRALQYNFDESTDAIGWGKSYRPGGKEISSVALAIPRAHRDRQIYSAAQMHDNGYDQPMMDIVAKEHPELETEGEKQEQVNKYKQHAKELGAAGIASTYYSTKKGWPTKVGAKVYHGAEKIPGPIGRKVSDIGSRTNFEDYLKDVDWGVKKPISRKMDAAAYRIAHPFGDPNDPNMAGISWEKRRINIPKWYNRRFPIHPTDYAGRQWERRAGNIAGTVKTRENINKFLQSGHRNIYRKMQARAAVSDVAEKTSGRMLQELTKARADIKSELKKPTVGMGVRTMSESDLQHYRQYLTKARDQLDESAKKALGKDPYTHENLRKLWDERYTVREGLPRGIKVGGEIGLGVAAVVGGGILAADKYQTYKYNKGEHINHSILKAVVPERIMLPKVSIKKTRQVTIPHNALTDALDLENEKIPVAGRLSVSKQEKLRLRNHQDISGQGYNAGLPMLGGVKVGAPAPVEGSLKKAVLHPSATAGLGPTKNMYVAGKRLPIDVSIGKKERWDNKQHRLRAKYDPYKLTAEDREHLAVLANESPEREAQISAFYHGDTRLQEMREDPNEMERLNKKNRYWLLGGEKGLTPIEDSAGGKGSSQTYEEYQEVHRRHMQAMKEAKREKRART